MTITFRSIAQQGTERETVKVQGSELTLEQYMSAVLDSQQQETRALVHVDGCPNVHAGNDRETVRCSG